LLSVPNEGTWLKQRVQYRWIEPNALAQSDHVQFFTAASLATVLEAGGFDVEPIGAVGFYFPHNGLSRRLLANPWTFAAGVRVARVVPVLKECLFAWARPRKTS
jgi:hypothetical protein